MNGFALSFFIINKTFTKEVLDLELAEKIAMLTNEFGVSGDEFKVAKIAAKLLEPYVDRVETDKLGNVSGYLSCGKKGAKTLMLDAHLDQIGFLVTEVTEDGFCRFMGMGVDPRMLPGSELTVLAKDGPLLGIVAATPPHLQSPGDNKKSVPIDELWLDLGMGGGRAQKLVSVGDYIAFAPNMIELQNGKLCGKSMDDRACFVCILHALELLKGHDFDVDLIIVGSTKEELGGHGARARAYADMPDYAIAIDVTHAKTADSTLADRVFSMGGGAVVGYGINSNPAFAQMIVETARAKKIPCQTEAIPSASGTNAWSIQVVETGIKTAVLSLPLKYMHSPVEVLDMTDVKNVGRLLAEFILSFDGNIKEVR